MGSCSLCKSRVTAKQLLRLVWQKQNKHVDVCPNCFEKHYKKMLKDATAPGHEKKLTDLKSIVEKWIKEQKSEL